MNLQPLTLIFYYLLGAFPTGALLAKFRGVDLTAVGSGNVGATNVARALGKKAGLITLVVDIMKGALASAIAFHFSRSESFSALAGFAAVLGHCYSIPGRLRGGKGVATSLGVLAYVTPPTAFGAIVTFAVSLALFQIVSLASIAAALLAPVFMMVTGSNAEAIDAIAAIAIIVTIRHRQNLHRMIRGEEPKFTAQKSAA